MAERPSAAAETMTYAFNPTMAEQSILGQIRNAQSNGRYNELFGGGKFYDFVVFPPWAGKTYQGIETHAAGAYQFEPETWKAAQAATLVPDFSPRSQDIAALWLLRTYGQESQWGTAFVDDGYIYGFSA
jgi:muramidase (phage lysozyme)